MWPLLTIFSGYSLLRSMWPIERGLERLAEQGFRHVGLADFQTMAGVERFDRAARRLGLEPWLGVTLPVVARSGVRVAVLLYALNPQGYRQLCRAMLEVGAAPALDDLASRDLLLLLPPEAQAPLAGWDYEQKFGRVVEAVAPGCAPRTRWTVPYWPVRFLTADDRTAYHTLVRIGDYAPEADARGLPSREEWQQQFVGLAEWPLAHAPRVFPAPGYRIPQIGTSLEDEFQRLRRWSEDGIGRRYPPPHRAEAQARLEHELAVIRQLGFQGYFLLVGELAAWARAQGIPIGPGRGSAAGSIVAYGMGITAVDPLAYGLIFERFLNPERGGLPDIDLDVDFTRRGDVLAHLRQHWGSQRVAQIGSYGTLAARAVLRDVGRVKGIPPEIVQQAMRAIEVDPGKTLAEQRVRVEPLLAPFDPDGDWIDLAERLEGLPRHPSTHAAGVVIVPGQVADWVPAGRDGDALITQMEMESVERLGLVKLDVLGLRTLGVVETIEKRLRRRHLSVDIVSVPPDDAETLQLLGRGDTDGVFQLDGDGVRRLLREMRPRHLREVMAVVALYRPGPMDAIPRYLKQRENPPAASDDPVSAILAETYGVMVYQEQLMAIVRTLAGYSWAEADQFRRAISKKDHALMDRAEHAFRERLTARAMEPAQARAWVEQIHAFGDYGFNKSHAAAYGLLAYYLAYLKAHWPLTFWAAELSSLMGAAGDRLIHAMRQAVAAGIPLWPPEINHSGVGFEADADDGEPGEQGSIWAGLGMIRGVNSEIARQIVDEREHGGAFTGYPDYYQRIGRRIDARTESALHTAGVFREIGESTGGAQMTWFTPSHQASAGPRRIDCLAAFGLSWPQPLGPIYVESDPRRAAGDRVEGQLRAWMRRHPGGVAVILVVGRGRGRRLGTASAHYRALAELRGLDQVGRVICGVEEEKEWVARR